MDAEQSFEQNLAVLATILMARCGDKVVVTQDEIQQARRILTTHQVQMVAFDQSRIFGDEVVIEFRHRSRLVLAGEVV